MRTVGKATDLITFSRASSATFLGSNGLIQTAATNVPRIEYGTDGSIKGLLVEESRTNLVTYSSDFSNAAWGKTEASIVSSATISPDGGLNASKLVPTTANGTHYVQASITTTAVSDAQTVFAKSAGYTWLALGISDSSNTVRITYFNLSNGTVGSVGAGVTASIQPIGNGWYRCTGVIGTAYAGANPIRVYAASANGVTSFAGDGTSGIYLYGAQLEAGAFPTSYIPTSGATATRSADVASLSVSNFGYRQSEGTVVFEYDAKYNSNPVRVLELGSDSSNRTTVYGGENGAQLYSIVVTNSVSQGVLTFGTATSLPDKAALSLATNNVTPCLNGTLQPSDTSVTLPVSTSVLLGTSSAGSYLNGHIKSIKYYPRRLTNTQLQEITK